MLLSVPATAPAESSKPKTENTSRQLVSQKTLHLKVCSRVYPSFYRSIYLSDPCIQLSPHTYIECFIILWALYALTHKQRGSWACFRKDSPPCQGAASTSQPWGCSPRRFWRAGRLGWDPGWLPAQRFLSSQCVRFQYSNIHEPEPAISGTCTFWVRLFAEPGEGAILILKRPCRATLIHAKASRSSREHRSAAV